MADRQLRIVELPAERLTAWLSHTEPRVPAMRIEADQWLVVGEDPGMPGDGMAVDVSHAYAAFGVEGEGAAELISQGIALDLDGLAPDFAGRTRLGDVAVILARTPAGYVLRCERSYAEWLSAWLERARAVTLSSGGT